MPISKPNGIRRAPYNSSYPSTFGSCRVGGDPHNCGEILCAALMEMSRELKDNTQCMQLVLDALKALEPNPGFLNLRDAMLIVSEEVSVKRAIWKGFSKFGMGIDASCATSEMGPIFGQIVESFSVPDFAKDLQEPVIYITEAIEQNNQPSSILIHDGSSVPKVTILLFLIDTVPDIKIQRF